MGIGAVRYKRRDRDNGSWSSYLLGEVKGLDLHRASVDDVNDIVNGDRRFGYVGGQDHLPHSRRRTKEAWIEKNRVRYIEFGRLYSRDFVIRDTLRLLSFIERCPLNKTQKYYHWIKISVSLIKRCPLLTEVTVHTTVIVDGWMDLHIKH